ncbi:MAG: hypothetical protein M1444_04440 [Patescibacteria group bacterium]|nr:hypothetical protein [Patescibacteria group bacterium]
MSRKIVLLIIFLFFLVLILLVLSLPAQKQPPPAPFVSPTPIQIIPNPRKEQSSISTIIPGKTSDSDLQKIIGEPLSRTKDGSLTIFNYATSQKNFTDTVSLKQDIVYYTVENVFDDSTYGTTSDFVSKIGDSYTKLYDNAEGLYWYIYLNQGVGVETNGSQVLKIVRFSPQDLSFFLSGIGASLGISQNQIPPNEGVSPAP